MVTNEHRTEAIIEHHSQVHCENYRKDTGRWYAFDTFCFFRINVTLL